jgi:AAA+ superfamily predicted ATPase
VAFQVVACLKDAQRYARLNAKMPSGVLLCGAPGTGKTLLGESSSVFDHSEYHAVRFTRMMAAGLGGVHTSDACCFGSSLSMLPDRMGTCIACADLPLHACFARIMHH